MELILEPTADRSRVRLQVWLTDVATPQPPVRHVDLSAYVDGAYRRISEQYPTFAYRLARDSGLLDLPGWEDAITAYWLIAFSEKSPLRTRLIVHLYRLALLEAAIREHRPVELRVGTDDEPLFRAVADLGKRYGLVTHRLPAPLGSGRARFKWVHSLWLLLKRSLASGRGPGFLAFTGLRLVWARLAIIKRQWPIRRLLRDHAREIMRALAGPSDPLVAFYTRYPVLWEFPDGRSPRELQFGTFPSFMAHQGFRVVYPCVVSCSASELRANLAAIVKQAEQLGLVFLDSLLPVWEFLKAYLGVSHLRAYLRWRRNASRRPILFDGLDVRDLVLRELDSDFLYDQELLANYGRAYAMRRFCRVSHPRAVFHPFEYQPMERAVYAGAKAGSALTAVVGTQSSVYFSGWMSFRYAEGEISRQGGLPALHEAPLPDFVLAPGTVFREALSRQYVPERVLLTGAVRYPEIQQSYSPGTVIDVDDPGAVRVLVVGSLTRGESLKLLRASAEVARTWPEVYLLIKFHYHMPLHKEWERLANEYGCLRFKVFDGDLATLLRTSSAVILASTAAVVEAMALGCMPVVLQNSAEYTFFPAKDFPEALFLCADVPALVNALNHCVKQTPEYWERRRAWPDVLEKMFYRLDGRQNERLFDALRSRGVL